jgi:hypothetical protein
LFGDRYQARVLSTPEEGKGVLAYLLLETRAAGARSGAPVLDRCSSAEWFDGFARARASARPEQNGAGRSTAEAPVVPAKSWLLTVGFKRAGLITAADAPLKKSADDAQPSAAARPGPSRARSPVLVNRSRT